MRHLSQLSALLVALLLVTSTGAVAVGGATASADELTDDDIADEVYVEDDGSAVLVYEDDHDDDDDLEALHGEFGLETETGLMHLLYAGEFEDDADELDAEFEAAMSPEEITAWGELIGEAPDDLEELDVDVRSEQTETTSEASADLSMVVEDDSAMQMLDSIDAEADLEMTASTFATSGDVSADFVMALPDLEEEAVEVTITETAAGYELEAAEKQQLADFEQAQWETAADAERTLENRYTAIAMELGGTADVELEAHEFETGEDGHVVDVEYAVTFSGVKEQVTAMLAQELADDQELDLDDQEAQAIADRMAELHVERVHFAAEMSDTGVAAEWDTEIDDYDAFVLGFAEIADTVDDLDDELADEFDEAREMLEAMDDADAAYTGSMALSIEPTGGETTVEFTAETETENYEQYVEELEDRELTEYVAETTFEFTAGLVGDELEATVDYEATGEDLLETTVEEMADAAAMDGGDDEFVEALESFQDAEFEAAKMTLDADEDEFELEAGAAFEDLTAFENVPLETDDDLTVTAINGVTEDETTTIYVTVEEFVDADASEDDVRDHDRVDEETAVYMPGEGDREVPSIDESQVRSFLDVAADGDDMPGFGGLAAVAALAATLIAIRRR